MIDPKVDAELVNLFTYHRPFGDQAARYENVRTQALQMARAIVENTPRSADQTAAIRKLRESVMTANAAIACNEKPPICACTYDKPRPAGAECLSCGGAIPEAA